MYFQPWLGLGLVYVIYIHTLNILLTLARPGASICYICIHTLNSCAHIYVYIDTHVYVCIVSILPVTGAADVGQPQYLGGH